MVHIWYRLMLFNTKYKKIVQYPVAKFRFYFLAFFLSSTIKAPFIASPWSFCIKTPNLEDFLIKQRRLYLSGLIMWFYYVVLCNEIDRLSRDLTVYWLNEFTLFLNGSNRVHCIPVLPLHGKIQNERACKNVLTS